MTSFLDSLKDFATGGSIPQTGKATPRGSEEGQPADAKADDIATQDAQNREANIGSGSSSGRGGNGVKGLYDKLFSIANPDEDKLAENPLDKYMDVTYGITLSITDLKAGSKTDTFASMLKANRKVIASTGSIEDSTAAHYVISSLVAKSVTTLTASNPEISQVIEMNIELKEPIGFSLDYNLRRFAKEFGLDPQPHRYIWRVDIWFSGFDPSSGSWVRNIDFGGPRNESKSKLTYFATMTTIESSITAEGTTYNITIVPHQFNAFREEITLVPGTELTFEKEGTLQDAMDKVQVYLDKWAEERGTNFKHIIELPDAIKELSLYKESGPNGGDYTIVDKEIRMVVAEPASAITIIMMILKHVPDLMSAGNINNPGLPNLSFSIFPTVDYGSAQYTQASSGSNKAYNDFVNVTVKYRVVPFFEWKSKTPGAQNAIGNAKKALRRVYNYTWSGVNTEVISLDTKLSVFFYVNDGFGGQSMDGNSPGNTNPTRTPEKAQEDHDDKRSQWKDRKQEPWSGGRGGGKKSPEQGSGLGPESSGAPKSVSAYGPGAQDPNAPYGSPVGDGYDYPGQNGDFGERTEDFRRRVPTASKYHRGEDIGVGIGTPVYATQNGVVECGYNQYGGNTIKVEGGRYDTRYVHLSRYAPGICGKRVSKGTIIGYSGNTGSATDGPHLHYEVLEDDKQVDPSKFGSRRPLGPGFRPSRSDRTGETGEGGDEGNGSSDQEIAYGRSIPLYSPVPVAAHVSQAPMAQAARESYELAMERRIGADLLSLNGMQVRGDPRWFTQYYHYSDESSYSMYHITAPLIRINMYMMDQSEYMTAGQNQNARQNDLSLGGWYEIISINHTFKGGVFTQTLEGARVVALNAT